MPFIFFWLMGQKQCIVLIKKEKEDKSFVSITLLWSASNVQRFSTHKIRQRKPPAITKFNPFLNGHLSENQYLMPILINFKCIVCLTTIVKMCSVSCFFIRLSSLFHKLTVTNETVLKKGKKEARNKTGQQKTNTHYSQVLVIPTITMKKVKD